MLFKSVLTANRNETLVSEPVLATDGTKRLFVESAIDNDVEADEDVGADKNESRAARRKMIAQRFSAG